VKPALPPVGSRVRVKPCAEWVDPAARAIVGREGVVTGHDVANDYQYATVEIDGDSWLFEPDEVEVAP
jgi:hypothetical protein